MNTQKSWGKVAIIIIGAIVGYRLLIAAFTPVHNIAVQSSSVKSVETHIAPSQAVIPADTANQYDDAAIIDEQNQQAADDAQQAQQDAQSEAADAAQNLQDYQNSLNATAHTAQCNDGTYSDSQSRRGTCSHHGGVAIWY